MSQSTPSSRAARAAKAKAWAVQHASAASAEKHGGAADAMVTWSKCVSAATQADIEEMLLAKLERGAIPVEGRATYLHFVSRLAAQDVSTPDAYSAAYNALRKELSIMPRKSQMATLYRHLVHTSAVAPNSALARRLVAKSVRSLSGVLVVTVFTAATPEWDDPATGRRVKQRFSCKHNCYYCPNEPGLPRSYLSEEPGVARGKKHSWDAVDQFSARVWTHQLNGHPIDKIELLVLGGTWSEYPAAYQDAFVRDVYFAANTFFDAIPKRPRRTLVEEIGSNETARVRIIGLTLETRPDAINPHELRRLRRLGCTRVQLGVQHTSNAVLRKVNRGCYTEDTVAATRLLKDAGFKIDYHLMPDLPGSDVDVDCHMFARVLADPDLQADQWKIYPCAVVPWSVLEKWFKDGTHTPMPHAELVALLLWAKRRVHPWIRLNRVVRDIPTEYISAGNSTTNLRQILHDTLRQRGLTCRCLRCREIRNGIGTSSTGMRGRQSTTHEKKKKKRKRLANRRDRRRAREEQQQQQQQQQQGASTASARKGRREKKKVPPVETAMLRRQYLASGGTEVFLSFETLDPTETRPQRENGGTRCAGSAEQGAPSSSSSSSLQHARKGGRAGLVCAFLRLRLPRHCGVAPPVIAAEKSWLPETSAVMQGKERGAEDVKASALVEKAGRVAISDVAAAAAAAVAVAGAAAAARDKEKTEKAGAKAHHSNDSDSSPVAVFPELHGAALVRELHVYGQMRPVSVSSSTCQASPSPSSSTSSELQSESQHVGFGRQLMATAQGIASAAGYRRLAVIAGIGTREYYRKLGFVLADGDGGFMVKDLVKDVPASSYSSAASASASAVAQNARSNAYMHCVACRGFGTMKKSGQEEEIVGGGVRKRRAGKERLPCVCLAPTPGQVWSSFREAAVPGPEASQSADGDTCTSSSTCSIASSSSGVNGSAASAARQPSSSTFILVNDETKSDATSTSGTTCWWWSKSGQMMRMRRVLLVVAVACAALLVPLAVLWLIRAAGGGGGGAVAVDVAIIPGDGAAGTAGRSRSRRTGTDL